MKSLHRQIVWLVLLPVSLLAISLDAFFLIEMSRTERLSIALFAGVAAATLLLGGLFYYLIWRISRRITEPVRKLGDALQDITTLETQPAAQVSELDKLVQGVNAMTARLQHEQKSCQDRIDEVTLAMRAKVEVAEGANHNARRFLAVASHELRQPLHALNLYITELQRKVIGAEQQHLLGQIDHSVEALTNLLNGLLDISKLDARSIVPQIQACSMSGLLERISNDHSVMARIKNIRLVVRPCSCYVSSDQQLLERILMNLVSNAIRYTRPNGSVLVACRKRGRMVCIEVRDNGIGISPADQASIFREFHQCVQPQLDTKKGLGLGLAIVDRLTRLLGHQITLRSAPDKGTVFSLILPAANPPDLPPASAEHGEDALADTSIKRLLVVDDDYLVLVSTAHILTSWGYEVSTADSMLAVYKLLGEGLEWDLIISDYQLEEHITGLNVIQAVKEKLNRPTPCILITGNTSQEVTNITRLEGHHILNKPVRPAKLRSLVEFLLKKNH